MNTVPETGSVSTAKQTNYNGIDYAKFVFAFFICAIHITPFPSDLPGIGNWLNFGIQNVLCRLAVPFYFSATGFLLFRETGLQNPQTDRLKTYCFKILRLLGLWSILLVLGGTDHLWYLSATVVAVALLGLCLRCRVKPGLLILMAVVLYGIGLLGDAYYGVAYYPLNRFSWYRWIDESYHAVFLTTRNGVFMGFPFVLLGALVGQQQRRPSARLAIPGIIGSVALLLAEVLVLERFSLSKGHNLYIFLLPATYFLLCAVCSAKPAGSPVCPKLRAMGVLIYLTHMLSNAIVTPLLAPLKDQIGSVLITVRFALVALLCLGVSSLVVWLGGKEKCKWLRWLYS